MEIRQLRYFLAVAEALSFTRAAQRLNMAQPPLSRQIKALEKEIGADLFDRTRHQLALTRAGDALREEAAAILAQLSALRQRVRRSAAIEPQRLSVGFVSAAGYSLLPQLVRRFRRGAPQAELNLRCLTNREQADAFDTGDIAVGLAWLPFERAGTRALPLLEDRFCVALPDDHALAGEECLSPAMLRGQAMVYGCRTPSIGARILRLVEGAAPVHRVADLRTAIDGVAAGLGLALVPASMRPLRAGHVVYRPLDCDERLTIGAVSLSDNPGPLVGEFLACASALVQPPQAPQ